MHEFSNCVCRQPERSLDNRYKWCPEFIDMLVWFIIPDIVILTGPFTLLCRATVCTIV